MAPLRRSIAPAFLASSLVLGLAATAQAGSPVAPLPGVNASFAMGPSFGFSSQTEPDGTAYLEIKSDENVSGIEVEINGDNGFHLSKTLSVKAGKSKKLTWKQKGTTVTYQLKMIAGDEQTDFEFEVTRPVISGEVKSFELLSDRADIVDKGHIAYRTSFALSGQELKVYNVDGELIEDSTDNRTIEAGASFELEWNSCDEVFMVYFKGTDDAGRFAEDRRVPWSVGIPHTDVNFDSGKWDVKPNEAPKLDEAFAVLVHELDALDKANKAVNANLSAQLYIVGYTDTVGSASDNKKLSENRARAIAQYFLDKGVWCEVYFAGMGERGQKVKTGDSVDEARNRRANYVIGVQKPAPGGEMPSPGQWRKLADARPRMLQALPELPESYLKYKEKAEAERLARRGGSCAEGASTSSGGGSGGASSGSSDGGGGSGSGGDGGSGGSGASSSGGSDAGGSSEGPPPSGETPSTKKGCSVGDEGQGGALALLALGLFWARRRRGA